MSEGYAALFCCDERRRELVRHHPPLNGIDYLEVSPDQTTLTITLLREIEDEALARFTIRIEGGERIREVLVTSIEKGVERNILVTVGSPGDFSTYTLRLFGGDGDAPPPHFDPLLSSIRFSFKAACPTDLDCKVETACPTPVLAQPDINYLAKDYASFRRLMLDRLALLVPAWAERSPADLGVALVELLAHVGDQLSYRQDAIATEAYLGTARRRVSVRRHARLVDYRMHEGSNARVFLQFDVEEDAGAAVLGAGTRVLTRTPGLATRIQDHEAAAAWRRGAEVFEVLLGATLRPGPDDADGRDEYHFHTWGNERCCLPAGAVRATLRNDEFVLGRPGDSQPPALAIGDFLLFEEVRGPHTGRPGDADTTRRHVVRLTGVTFNDDLTENPLVRLPVVEIGWSVEDALPFPLCLWEVEVDDSTTPGKKQPVSVARRNIVLADHGFRIDDEDLGAVPRPLLVFPSRTGTACEAPVREAVPPRYRPRLREAPLTFAMPPPDEGASACALLRADPARATPSISLLSSEEPTEWLLPIDSTSGEQLHDLLNARSDAPYFVVETETGGTATLRFGDGEHGRRPAGGTRFVASYRVGNGSRGNVGAEAIAHVVGEVSGIRRVRNPLPAQGGTDPETLENVRQSAPVAFRRQERAVTADDYAEVAGRFPDVQRGAGTLRWTGSWYTAFVTVDRIGGLPVDSDFKSVMRDHLERYRLAGHDLEVDGACPVPLEIELHVCVDPGYFRSDVERALRDLFSSRCRTNGQPGFFHPDNLTFGKPVYLSAIEAAAQAVPGVAAARVTTFQRRYAPSTIGLHIGRLDMARLEVAQLENNPNFPERGTFYPRMEGGE